MSYTTPYPTYTYAQRWQAMRALLLAVSRGWHYWTSGSIAPGKLRSLAEKFDARFNGLHGWTLSRAQSDYNKRIGQARPRLICAQAPDDTTEWFLLSDNPELPGETLKDAQGRRSRIRIYERFELIQVTKPRHLGGGQHWTYRYPHELYAGYVADGSRFAAHESPRRAQQLIDFLACDPGFSGLRTQRIQLYRQMVRVRTKQKPYAAPLILPGLPFLSMVVRQESQKPI